MTNSRTNSLTNLLTTCGLALSLSLGLAPRARAADAAAPSSPTPAATSAPAKAAASAETASDTAKAKVDAPDASSDQADATAADKATGKTKGKKAKKKAAKDLDLTISKPSKNAQGDDAAKAKGDSKVNPHVIMETSMGNVELELFQDKAPISVANFLKYVDEGFYNGTIFHRVIPNFMIQGGGFTAGMEQKKTHDQIKNEANNGLKNDLGTLAMARTNVVDSATAQFFINVKNNDFLNYRAPTPDAYGYAVFGKVVSGMDVVEKIKVTPTTSKGMNQDVPVETVMIKTMKRK